MIPDRLGQPATLVDLLSRRADRHPDRTAFIYLGDGEQESDRLTYGTLVERARPVAALLRAHVAPRGRILLPVQPGLDFIVSFLGCLFANRIPVPLVPPHPARPEREIPRLQALVTDCEPEAILAPRRLLAAVEQVFAPDRVLGRMRRLAQEDVLLEGGTAGGEPECSADDVAFLQYTSGSTTSPRGVMVTHANLLHNCEMIRRRFGHTASSTVVSWLPLFHDMGLVGQTLHPLYIGSACIAMPPAAFIQRPIRWLRAISAYRGHTSSAPNSGYDWCVQKTRAEQREGLDLSSWRVAVNGAEPVRAETIGAFVETFAPYGFKCETFAPCFGLAEATLLVTGLAPEQPARVLTLDAAALEQSRVEEPAPNQEGARVSLVGCGTAVLDRRVAIVDPETRLACRPGRVGEIWVAGADVARGYWGRPEESAATFAARTDPDGDGPFLRTGDLGFLHEEQLFVAGRIKELIIVDGRNLYPRDLELTVESCHPALASNAAAVFSTPGEQAERPVVAVEVERVHLPRGPRASAELDSIARAVQVEVGRVHGVRLREVLLLLPGTLPRTSSGKLRRLACRAAYQSDTLGGILYRRGDRTPPAVDARPP